MISRAFILVSTLIGFALTPSCDSRPSATDRALTASSSPGSTAPRLRLRISGNLEGYLMPCGCASGQLGGLARRVFRQKLDRRHVDVYLEGGNLLKKTDELGESKLMAILEILENNGYHGMGVGAKDLQVDPELLAGLLSFYPKLPALSADLLLADGKPWLMEGKPVVRSYQEHKFDHVTVRISSLTMSLPGGDKSKNFKLAEPAASWRQAMHGVADATYRVLMIHADRETIKKLELAPKPDLIIAVSHDYVEPKSKADQANGVPLVYTGIHGRVLLDVTLARGPDGPMLTRIKPVPLKGSITAPAAMRDKDTSSVILGHRQTVKEDNLLAKLANRQDLPDGLAYVGSAACTDCHEEDSETCAEHAHSHAWQTLIDSENKEGWPVTHYPECVSCHVVGYGYKSGFQSPKKTPELLNVTCDNCHGPGNKHVASDGDVAMQKVEVKTCTICHNPEHSPKFDYSKFWAAIKHGDK